MARWSERITTKSGRVTFRADPAKMEPAVLSAVQDAAYWVMCDDGMYYYQSGAFEGKTDVCGEILMDAPPPDPALEMFVSIYGPEPNQRSLKRIWQQARSTFVDDRLPDGMTRASATAITNKVRPYGLPGARFFRLRRKELPVGHTAPADYVFHRVAFIHEATETLVRYLDYSARLVTDDAYLDDVVIDWQQAIALTDPASFPKSAIIAPRHTPEIERILTEAQAS